MKYQLLLLLGLFVCETLSDECKKSVGNNCECKTDKGVIVNLSEYGQKNMFVNKTKEGDPTTYFSYDPCEPMKPPNVPDECKSAAVCQINAGGVFVAGDFSDVEFSGDPAFGNLQVTYHAGDRQSIVELVCGSDPPKLEVFGEGPTKTYKFRLSGKQVPCANLPGPGGLSPGSVLLIIFFVLLLIYVIGGVLYLRFAHGARGVEQIPNYDFWVDLPALIKDGVVFVSRGCKPEPSYQQI